jgi:hypothetical protein
MPAHPGSSKDDRMIAKAKSAVARTVVGHPCDEISLRGPLVERTASAQLRR